MNLKQTQEMFFRLITAPEGVEAGLRDARLYPAVVDELIVADERLSSVGRLDIYANMYFFRILDVLRADFPKLVRVLGDEGFHNLATDYLLAFPSQHPSIRNVGDRLAGFLRGRGGDSVWLGDLAALEWARQDVFDAADDDLVTMDLLRERDPNTFASLELRLIAAFRSVRVDFAVDERWAEIDETPAETPADSHVHFNAAPAAEPRTLLVWRQGTLVYHRPVGDLIPLEIEVFAELTAGTTFGRVCDVVSSHVAEDEAAQLAFQLLARWVSDGLLALS